MIGTEGAGNDFPKGKEFEHRQVRRGGAGLWNYLIWWFMGVRDARTDPMHWTVVAIVTHCPRPSGGGGGRRPGEVGMQYSLMNLETGEGGLPPSPSAPPPMAIFPRSSAMGFVPAS
ncbi:MAG: hypothetical protein CVV31_00150 [Methanomicrobiales archaeon HGW-Methanomicrobiales-2]|jgi:hypothetical protein|nr:MAG: hypothetical protein CVV31_00150 [Methanomicrobiales archaeon HGW-Methanomicrobiales-2]